MLCLSKNQNLCCLPFCLHFLFVSMTSVVSLTSEAEKKKMKTVVSCSFRSIFLESVEDIPEKSTFLGIIEIVIILLASPKNPVSTTNFL